MSVFAAQQSSRKMRGQFFTPPDIALFLAQLAGAGEAHSVLDPMAGIGNMLSAVEVWSTKALLCGIELENQFGATAQERHDNWKILIGDAFRWDTVRCLPQLSFDLVITNPPFVRYQSTGSAAPDRQSGETVREGLLDIVSRLSSLSEAERLIFDTLVRSYSGLADIAVPAVLLAAAFVRTGGRLALVLPDACLTREYGDVLHYLLTKLFNVEIRVEDGARDWFDEAQVKTSLIVARRVSPQELPDGVAGYSFGSWQLNGRPRNDATESGRNDPPLIAQSNGASVLHQVYPIETLRSIVTRVPVPSWVRFLEPALEQTSGCEAPLPPAVSSLGALITGPVTSLREMGFEVGQGLRTGANPFFYCEAVATEKSATTIASALFPGEELTIPSAVLHPVVRRQSELQDRYDLEPLDLRGRVLLIEPHDPDSWQQWPDLQRLIKAAERFTVGSKTIPELSAVRTNATQRKTVNGFQKRSWFMLPGLQPRHLPDLLIPRVNARSPRTVLNANRSTVVDANFSTIWSKDCIVEGDVFVLLALMNSAWSALMFEALGNILGGGALKLEAAHLRRLALPFVSRDKLHHVRELGRALVREHDVQTVAREIDAIVAESLAPTTQSAFADALEKLKTQLMARRTLPK